MIWSKTEKWTREGKTSFKKEYKELKVVFFSNDQRYLYLWEYADKEYYLITTKIT